MTLFQKRQHRFGRPPIAALAELLEVRFAIANQIPSDCRFYSRLRVMIFRRA